jgi:hypothetical protein
MSGCLHTAAQNEGFLRAAVRDLGRRCSTTCFEGRGALSAVVGGVGGLVAGAPIGLSWEPASPLVDHSGTLNWAPRCAGPTSGAPALGLLGDCPPGGSESQALAGEVGKVDDTGSGEQVGEVALRSSTTGFASAPRFAGQVADLAFHLGSGRPVEALPRRVLLCGAGLLQGELVGVDRDDPAGLGLGAPGSQRAGRAELPEAARPPPAATGTMGTLCAAGQVTVPALRSIVKASLANPPVVLRTGGTFAITTWPAAVNRSRVLPSA